MGEFSESCCSTRSLMSIYHYTSMTQAHYSISFQIITWRLSNISVTSHLNLIMSVIFCYQRSLVLLKHLLLRRSCAFPSHRLLYSFMLFCEEDIYVAENVFCVIVTRSHSPLEHICLPNGSVNYFKIKLIFLSPISSVSVHL